MPILNVIVTLLIAVAGAIGNLTIIYVFIQYKSLRCVNNIFVVQLSIVDLTKALTILPLKAAMQTTMEVHMDKAVCATSSFLSSMAFVHSPLVLAAIAIVRYIVVVKPRLYLALCSRSRIAKCSLFLLSVALLFSVLPFIGVGEYSFSKHHGVCFADWSRKNVAFRTIFYLLTMGTTYPVMIFCYGSIFCKLKRHSRTLSRAMLSNPGGRCAKGSKVRKERTGTGSSNSPADLRQSMKEAAVGAFSDSDYDRIRHHGEPSGMELQPLTSKQDGVSSVCKVTNGEGEKEESMLVLEGNSGKVTSHLSKVKARFGIRRNNRFASYRATGIKRPYSYTWFETFKNLPNKEGTDHIRFIKSMETILLQGKSVVSDKEGHRRRSLQEPAHIIVCAKRKYSEEIQRKQRTAENRAISDTAIRIVKDDEWHGIGVAPGKNLECKRVEFEDSFSAFSDQDTGSPSRARPARHRMSRMEIKVTKIMFIIVLAYTVCWLPAFIVNILMLSSAIDVSDDWLFGIVTLVDFKVLLNPLIYGMGSPMIRSAIYNSIGKGRNVP